MKLTKIFALTVSCALCAGVLVGCGGNTDSGATSGSTSNSTSTSSSTSTAVDVKAVADSILAANPISNQMAVNDNLINLEMFLPADSFTAYAGAVSNDQSDAGHVVVIQYADGQEKTVTDALETYRQNKVVFFGNYPDFADAQAHLENDYALVSGNGVAVLAVASNECTDVSAMINAAEAAVK